MQIACGKVMNDTMIIFAFVRKNIDSQKCFGIFLDLIDAN